jgi:hypothetical protein
MPSGKRSREARKKASVPRPPSASRRVSRRWLVAGAAVVVAGLAAGLALAFTGGSGAPKLTGFVSPGSLGPAGPEGPPIERGIDLAPAGAPAPGTTVDGIQCGPTEQLVFHIHARLTIFVGGTSVRVPAGIGIADPQAEGTPAGAFVVSGSCFAWLHTHAADGIIHMESPVQRTFTLGNFFDVWKQPLSATRVGPAKGKVTALVNGKVWNGNPRTIPLHAHTQVQLDVGRPLVAAVHISNWNGL